MKRRGGKNVEVREDTSEWRDKKQIIDGGEKRGNRFEVREGVMDAV